MLKIKDNIDLKELEKFGFSIGKGCNQFSRSIPSYFNGGETSIVVMVNIKNKKITSLEIGDNFGFTVPDNEIEELIQDLTKAGLVEKVEE